MGLFGSGWQASAHIEYLSKLCDFERVKVYSPNEEHRREIAREMSRKLDRPVVAAESPRETEEGSDFNQAARAAWDPVFDGHWVEKGMYIASIRIAGRTSKRREIDDET